jgi:hypothetical protein
MEPAMNIRTLTITSTLLLFLLSAAAGAEERMIAGSEQGPDLVVTGATDTLTAPVRIVTEIGEEVKNYGALGVIGGPVRGGIKAGGQALRGAARMTIGILDVVKSLMVGPDHE